MQLQSTLKELAAWTISRVNLTSIEDSKGINVILLHKYVITAVLNYKKSNHTSIGCEPSSVFLGRIPYNMFDLKYWSSPTANKIPTSQSAQDILDQTQMIHQDVRRIVMQAHIKHEAYYDKKANVSKRKEADNVYFLQPKADHQRSKIQFTEFQWIDPYIIKKVLPNNNLVCKIGTNKTQVLLCIRMRQFTSRQPIPDIRITPQEWKPDPEVMICMMISSNMMICMLQRGSVNMNNQFSTPKVTIQLHPIHPKFQYSLIYQPRKRGTHQELHWSVSRKCSPDGGIFWRNR